MKCIQSLLVFAGILLLFGFAPEKKITIFTIGDSTCANKTLANQALERGWGQALSSFFDERYVVVDNHAQNGRSSLSFLNEGRWKPILDKIQKGDYVLIQFGHNDEKPDSTRHTDPETTYKEILKKYVVETREKGGIPVLITSMVRRNFNEQGQLVETHGDYPKAVRELAAELKVILVDHNLSSKALVQNLGPDSSKSLFMWVEKGTNPAAPEGKQDDTHLRAAGARAMARLVVNELTEKIPELKKYVLNSDFVVAKDGSGDFMTVQEAVNAVPVNRKTRTTIFIRKGIYKERVVIPETQTNLSFVGESQTETILTFDNFANRKTVLGENMGTSGSSSLYIYANGFEASNMTFENSAGNVGQAVAVFVAGDQIVFRHCRFLGNQDTLYTWGKSSRQYYEECYIEGTVDFIFGSSTCVFDRCEIHAKRSGGYLTAASTPEGTAYGYVFLNCKLTADEGVKDVYLGRPWRPYAKTVYLDCEMGSHIKPEGWHNWGKPEAEKSTFYAEFPSKGVDVRARVPWSHQLTKKQAESFTIKKMLGDRDGWNPVQ
ncbi:MAG TPA: pectinesterase family protein [Bacteroidales bacterium]|nr:pectinesterase family protein [Bacteroidales bacterium]